MTACTRAWNYSISRKVFGDTFISRSLKGLSYGQLYGTTASRIPKREVKIMRGAALGPAELPESDRKERLRDESDDKDLRDTARQREREKERERRERKRERGNDGRVIFANVSGPLY